MRVPLFDLRVTDLTIKSALLEKLNKVLSHGVLFSGPEIEELETKVAKFCGSNYAIGVSSGSSALFLALKAAGIEPGDEIITTPLTWTITINAIVACGAIPVFADIKSDFNIDPKSIENLISTKTKAIVPMHYAGHMCDMFSIMRIAKKYSLIVVEDAAQAFGASLGGQMAGTYSSAGAFSMNPMKNFGGYGEAGMVVTNDLDIFNKLLLLRHAGTDKHASLQKRNLCIEPSLNHKMDTINAALLLVSFSELKRKMIKKEQIALTLNKKLHGFATVPAKSDDEVHGRYVYPLQVDNRDELMKFLETNGIETKIFNAPLACDSPIYQKFKTHPIPNSELLLSRNLIIPSHEKLTKRQLDYMEDTFKQFNKRFY